MAEFLTTNGTASYIEKVIIDSEQELTLVSPYLQLSKTFYQRLQDASDRGVKIKIIYGKDELKSDEMDKLTDLDTLQLYFFENLHAKCYFNEQIMVITSMNMYEFSEKNNREMGILVDAKDDQNIYKKAVRETDSILRSAEPVKLSNENKGYCIRCEDVIDYDIYRPFCNGCYNIWSNFNNPKYVERICHKCREPSSTCKNRPLCINCWLESAGNRDRTISIR